MAASGHWEQWLQNRAEAMDYRREVSRKLRLTLAYDIACFDAVTVARMLPAHSLLGDAWRHATELLGLEANAPALPTSAVRPAPAPWPRCLIRPPSGGGPAPVALVFGLVYHRGQVLGEQWRFKGASGRGSWSAASCASKSHATSASLADGLGSVAFFGFSVLRGIGSGAVSCAGSALSSCSPGGKIWIGEQDLGAHAIRTEGRLECMGKWREFAWVARASVRACFNPR